MPAKAISISPKEQVIALVKSLPDDWSQEEIEFYIYMRKRIERSVGDIRERHRDTNFEMRHQIEAWKRRLLRTR